MRIGIFDSGVGGLIVAKAIRQLMPEHDYVYLGDTKRVPYGTRSHETVYEFTRQGVDFLFKKENCALVILACNTASARALRKIQEEYLPKYNESRKILGETSRNVIGVLVPTAEECAKYETVGILGTPGTVSSNTFPMEIKKINSRTKVYQSQAPTLVPLAEEGEKKMAIPFLKKYLKPLLIKKPKAIALGCTHYPFFKKEIKKIVGPKIKIISQDEIVPKKLKDYLLRHPEMEGKLSKKKTAKILVTDITKNVTKLSREWFGKNSKPNLVQI